jgi:hypothetical protein
MAQKTTPGYPNTGSILALVGGIIVVLGGALFLAVSAFILPHLDYSKLTPPAHMTAAEMPGLVSGIVGVMGLFGLISGVIVLTSAVILRVKPGQRETWGILILAFSVLSFVGLGGFIIGAVLGIVGGVMILRWKPPAS